jgi:NAD(P)-dependent dehydrogenase (short-subunit alcohol dehydrogenase family)
MTFDFTGKVALIAGAGPGVGATVAAGVVGGGGAVVLAARRPETLEAVTKRLGADSSRALGVPTDVSQPDAVEALVDRAIAEFGRIDVLVNSAFPDAHRCNVLDMTRDDLEDWRRRVEVGGYGTLLVSRYVAPHMVAAGTGSIVNVTSLSSRQGYAGRSDYGAAKAQAHLLAHSLADELGPHGVRVNCVAPGFVWSEGLEAFYERESAARGVPWETVAAEFRVDIALGREVTNDEVAAAILFLASDLASGISGAMLDVNAGHHFA